MTASRRTSPTTPGNDIPAPGGSTVREGDAMTAELTPEADRLTDDRLRELRRIASTMVDVGYRGSWRWAGTPEQPRLIDQRCGEVFDVTCQHRHYRYFHDAVETQDMPCPRGTVVGSYCSGVSDGPIDKEGTGSYDDGHQGYGVVRFMTPDKIMRSSTELPIFEVCREATTAHDPRVYRDDIVGFRSPNAEYLAAVDAATVLALVDEVQLMRLRAAAWPASPTSATRAATT